MVIENQLETALDLVTSMVKINPERTALVVVRDLLTEALENYNNTRKELNKGVDLYSILEDYNNVLQDLALPDTSLYWCNRLYDHLKELEQKYLKIESENHYEFILSELDKAIKCIIQLDFKGALTGLVDLIQYIKICPNDTRGSSELLDKAVIKTCFNTALKQYIMEGNVTVH